MLQDLIAQIIDIPSNSYYLRNVRKMYILSHETVASIEANLLISLYLTYYVCDIRAFKKLEKSRTLKVCCLISDIAVLNHPFSQKKKKI